MRAMVPDQYEGDPPPRESGPDQRDGSIRFHPPRYARTFQQWHENLRDWCISRQLWWGHRIPVWSRTLSMSEAGNVPASLESGMTDDLSWCTDPLCSRTDDSLSVRIQLDREAEEVRILACIGRDAEALEAELAASGYAQDEDVLDTWFSSALWPISTMGWPDPSAFPGMSGLLESFNPTEVLSTGREIITLWVSRMVMFNRFFQNGEIPFRDVYIHPIIQDGFGQKMSKSLGNGVDPRDISLSHGTDALRFVMTQLATSTQDVRLPLDLVCPYSGQTFMPEFITSSTGHQVTAPIQSSPGDPSKKMVTVYGELSGLAKSSEDQPLARNSSAKFDAGRAFANKFWNAARFALIRSEAPAAVDSIKNLHLVDRWMISRVANAQAKIDEAIETYQFSMTADLLYDLVWRDFCDWYLEGIKPTIGDDAGQRQTLLTMLDAITRLLHPVCPFVTEALWPHISSAGEPGLPGVNLPSSPLAAQAAWPQLTDCIDEEAEAEFEQIKEVVNAIRRARADHGVPPKVRLTLGIGPAMKPIIEKAEAAVRSMATLDAVSEYQADGIQVHVDGRSDVAARACSGG